MNPSQNAIVRASEKEVLERLVQLRTARTPNRRLAVAADLLPLFERNPSLTSQHYHVGSAATTPLHHYLRAGIDDVETIKKLYKLCPTLQILRTCAAAGSLPIHSACRYCSAEVIEFLLSQQKPGLMLRTDWHNACPFDYAMRSTKLSTAEKKKLLGLCPEAVGTGYPLCHALQEGYPIDFLECIVQVWPSTSNTATLVADATCVLNLEQAKVLCKLLPKLTCLSLTNLSWQFNACIYLLKELKHNKTVAELHGLVLPALAAEGDAQQQELLRCFQLTLQENSTLQRMTKMHSAREGARFRNLWIQAVDAGLASNRSLTLFNYMIAGGNAVADPSLHVDIPLHSSRRTCLRISGVSFANTDCANLFQLLPATSFHQILITAEAQDDISKDDITSLSMHLAALLRQRHTFQYMACAIHILDMSVILEALKANDCLLCFESLSANTEVMRSPKVVARCLEMLKHHNMTLTTFKPLSEDHPGIQYFLDLNRHGRKAVRAAAHMDTVLDLLRAVQEDSALRQPQASNANRCQGILYGLLHESLGLWGNEASVVCRKRKYGNH